MGKVILISHRLKPAQREDDMLRVKALLSAFLEMNDLYSQLLSLLEEARDSLSNGNDIADAPVASRVVGDGNRPNRTPERKKNTCS